MKFEKRLFVKMHGEVECTIITYHQQRKNVMDPNTKQIIDPYRSTAAAILLPSGEFFVGIATCSPKDQFVKATGRSTAIKRAYHAYADKTYAKQPSCYSELVDLAKPEPIKFILDRMKLQIANTHKALIEQKGRI